MNNLSKQCPNHAKETPFKRWLESINPANSSIVPIRTLKWSASSKSQAISAISRIPSTRKIHSRRRIPSSKRIPSDRRILLNRRISWQHISKWPLSRGTGFRRMLSSQENRPWSTETNVIWFSEQLYATETATYSLLKVIMALYLELSRLVAFKKYPLTNTFQTRRPLSSQLQTRRLSNTMENQKTPY